MDRQVIEHAAVWLADSPTESTLHMSVDERTAGIAQMLDDLYQLATRDGCIAAAWALEKLLAVATDAEDCEADIDDLFGDLPRAKR